MNDFEGLLSRDYGFKPSGKSVPMATAAAAPRSTSTINSSSSPFDFDIPPSKMTTSSSTTSPAYDFSNLGNFDDVFVNSKSSSVSNPHNQGFNSSTANFDSIFGGGGGDSVPAARFSSVPVFDKPVYDDDVSSSPVNKHDDIFATRKSNGGSGGSGGDAFDDLLGGKKEPISAKPKAKGSDRRSSNFDDLLPGFGGSSAPSNRSSSDTTKKPPSVLEDPFVVLESTSPPVSSSSGVFSDPLEEMGNVHSSIRKKFENSSSGGAFDDIDPLDGFAKSIPPFSAGNGREKDESPVRAGSRVAGRQTSVGADGGEMSSVTSPDRDFGESPHSVFEIPSVSVESNKFVLNASSPVHGSSSFRESNTRGHFSSGPEENLGPSDQVWLTVSEVPLFTQLTAGPPPSRSPPSRPARYLRAESGSSPASNAHHKIDEYSSFPGSSQCFQSPKSASAGAAGSFASPLDELEEFAMSKNQSSADENVDISFGEDFDTNSVAAASAAAMKEAMDRAEAKFKYAKRERENVKASRSSESVQAEKEENTTYVDQDREFREGQERLMRERQQRERDEEERRRMEEEERRHIEKERGEKEREKRRVERERELARQAVERATREARERAAIEARTRAERAAVQKAQAEARERAERAAVQRAQAEARERASASAKERADKAAADAREKAQSEAREKEARESAAARASQQKNEPDFDSIFGYNSRASSAPRPRATSSDPFDTQFQTKPTFEATRTSVNSTSSMRKASSSTNIVDDLSSIFGGPQPSGPGVFQDVDGETEDRRRARLERHQRTQERAAKALAEKNARDLEAQREQNERDRIGETLDVEIKRWAAGKEGNLRALLSTLQYVLWPDCGWQPVSLTDLITGVAVKKVYRKATLCIHPDKVQQKGATLQQKYVAAKVFDLLKEAWNKFNSEELF